MKREQTHTGENTATNVHKQNISAQNPILNIQTEFSPGSCSFTLNSNWRCKATRLKRYCYYCKKKDRLYKKKTKWDLRLSASNTVAIED